MAIDPTRVLRLNMPLWQGGDNPNYLIGSRVLAAIAPEAAGPVETIAIPPVDAAERPRTKGIVSRDTLLNILTQTREAIARHDPQAIVTLGGDCLVDLAPIAYLNERYAGDLAVLWIDAHPDIMSAEQYANAHAHVLAVLMGEGDPDFVATVPNKVNPDNVLYVGLTETTPYETDFIARRGISHLKPETLKESVQPVIDWLRGRGLRHVAVHFDLDVLDPALCDFLLFQDPSLPPGIFDGVAKGRLKMEQVQAILQAVASEADLVGLAITEYVPWSVIKLAGDLRKLPLLGGAQAERADRISAKPPAT